MNDSNYEALRQKNVAEREALFSQLFKNFEKENGEIKDFTQRYKENTKEDEEEEKDLENEENEAPPTKRRKLSKHRPNSSIGRHVRLEFRKTYNTRSRTGTRKHKGYNFEDSDESSEENKKLKIRFPWNKSGNESEYEYYDDDDFDSEDEFLGFKKRKVRRSSKYEDYDEKEFNSDAEFLGFESKKRVHVRVKRSVYNPDSIPSVDEITDEMLENVSVRASAKVYSSKNGTSCHQCRQKTLDTKTVCRSGQCIGIRGQFCGPCLRGRYGEDAVEALKDPKWACPPCRGLCNCSICRRRNGQAPTGVLVPHAQGEGFSSVKDYLQAVYT